MSSSFRRPYPLVARPPVVWNQTTLKPVITEPGATTVMASIQPARLTDYDENTPAPIGADLDRTIRIYTDTRLNVMDGSNDRPGDVVIYFDTRYIVFAESIYQAMGSSIDHFRYLATAEKRT